MSLTPIFSIDCSFIVYWNYYNLKSLGDRLFFECLFEFNYMINSMKLTERFTFHEIYSRENSWSTMSDRNLLNKTLLVVMNAYLARRKYADIYGDYYFPWKNLRILINVDINTTFIPKPPPHFYVFQTLMY